MKIKPLKKRNSLLKIMKKTKIMAIGDLHGDTNLIKKLSRKADEEEIDIMIFAGDLTFFERSTKNLIGPFVKDNRKILLIPGNHESNETINFLTNLYPNTQNIHESPFIENDLGIFGVGSADSGPFSITEKEITFYLEKSHEQIKDAKKKILVTHMHPAKTKSEFIGYPGSKAIKDAITKFNPLIVINAHVHEAGGLEDIQGSTKIFNVSRKEKIFEI